MDWWNSFETLSKIQTAVGILAIVSTVLTFTFQLRGHQLKKSSDKAKTEERARMDTELLQKTEEAHALAAQMEQQKEEEKTRPPAPAMPRHFPKEKTPLFFKIAGEGLSNQLTIQVRHLRTDDGIPEQIALEIAQVFDPKATQTGADATVTGAAPGITILEANESGTPSKPAANFQRAFEAIGFKCGYRTADIEAGVLCIFVGTRE